MQFDRKNIVSIEVVFGWNIGHELDFYATFAARRPPHGIQLSIARDNAQKSLHNNSRACARVHA